MFLPLKLRSLFDAFQMVNPVIDFSVRMAYSSQPFTP